MCLNKFLNVFVIFTLQSLQSSLRQTDISSWGVLPSVCVCVCVCVCVSVIRCKNNRLHLQWVGRTDQTEKERKKERKKDRKVAENKNKGNLSHNFTPILWLIFVHMKVMSTISGIARYISQHVSRVAWSSSKEFKPATQNGLLRRAVTSFIQYFFAVSTTITYNMFSL
jgi:hypothetical protein